MTIDLHAHYYPAELLDLMDRHGATTTGNARGTGGGGTPEELEQRFALMDKAGVDRQAISFVPQAPYFADQAAAVETARVANDLFAQAAAENPARFSVLATLPLPHVDASLAELDRALALPGVRGVAVLTTVLGQSLAAPEHQPLFAELHRRKATVLVHSAGEGCDWPLINDHGLAWTVGAQIETTVAIVHLMQAGIVERYPDINFVHIGLGGLVGSFLSQFDTQETWYMPRGHARPSDLVKRMYYDTCASHGPGLRALVESVGADRVVHGSDFPFWGGELYPRSTEYVRTAGFSAGETEAILGGTAERLLGLG
ncbi:amidohydrolase family protein [Yinghuangia soli]|uniref:Amidohydrolase n=1 Tax=Yinghuangia soli TaxID=2908204 RepID=A0AA41PUH6_9ACTN|nr:amidohydrolase family protein [Yinghuangia soli]MCF2526103.1 amidohydrolase [Yinghuangia soli]